MQDAPSALPALLAFGTVIALISIALWVLKRLQGSTPGNARLVTLVGGLALGPRERIAIIEADGRRWMIGVTGQSITLLAELDRSTAMDGPAAVGPPAAPPGFGRLLERIRRDA